MDVGDFDFFQSLFSDITFNYTCIMAKKQFAAISDAHLLRFFETFRHYINVAFELINIIHSIYGPASTYKNILMEFVSNYKNYISLGDNGVFNEWRHELLTSFEQSPSGAIRQHCVSERFITSFNEIQQKTIEFKEGLLQFEEISELVLDMLKSANISTISDLKSKVINLANTNKEILIP